MREASRAKNITVKAGPGRNLPGLCLAERFTWRKGDTAAKRFENASRFFRPKSPSAKNSRPSAAFCKGPAFRLPADAARIRQKRQPEFRHGAVPFLKNDGMGHRPPS